MPRIKKRLEKNKAKGQILSEILYICIPFAKKWSRGRVARQWSATPSTAVRIRSRPQEKRVERKGKSIHKAFFQYKIMCRFGSELKKLLKNE